MNSWKKKRLFLSAFNYRANKKKSGKRSLSLLVIDQQDSYQTPDSMNTTAAMSNSKPELSICVGSEPDIGIVSSLSLQSQETHETCEGGVIPLETFGKQS